ncbi:MAG: FMN-binding protein [Spirochaetales bacterium]|nr:FMN-binding protein [Spirochaetales bacterium]
MKQGGFYRDRVYPVLFMIILTAVCISLVSGISVATMDLVRINADLFMKKAVLFAAGLDVPEDPRQAEALFSQRVQVKDDGAYYTVIAESGNAVSAVVLPAEGPGVWGEIKAVIGYESDLETLIAVDFTEQNETPGLGARISEDWFKRQFKGKNPPFVLVDEGTRSSDPGKIDAITGATFTSRYVRDLINTSAEQIKELVTGGQ